MYLFCCKFTIITCILTLCVHVHVYLMFFSTFDDKVNEVFGGLASSTLHYFNFCGEVVQLQLGVSFSSSSIGVLVAIIIHMENFTTVFILLGLD